MKKIILLACMYVLQATGTSAIAQQPDMVRMDRDLNVMEKVVNEMFRQADGFEYYRMGRQGASASYVPGYGVIIQLPQIRLGYYLSDNLFNTESLNNVMDGMNESLKKMEMELELKAAGESMKQAEKEMKQQEKSEKKGKGKKQTDNCCPELAPLAPLPPTPPEAPNYVITPAPRAYSYGNKTKAVGSRSFDSLQQVKKELIIKKMQQFMVNYGDLLTQLPVGEKILLLYDERASGNQNNFSGYTFSTTTTQTNKRREFPRLTGEVKRSDLGEFRSGRISQKELEQRIKTAEISEQNDDVITDCKVFAGIMETLLNNSPGGFHIVRKVNFSYLPGFGCIFRLPMRNAGANQYYTFSGEDGLNELIIADDDDESIPGIRDSRKKNSDSSSVKTENNKKLEAELKDDLLDYVRVMRHFNEGLFILLDVQLPRTKDNPQPGNLRMRVKKEVVTQYEQNKITREQALAQIVIMN